VRLHAPERGDHELGDEDVTEVVTQFSREELFKMVWANPAAQVAEGLGISESTLRNICSRHAISCPSNGYWARVNAGEHFPLPPLRAVKDSKLEQIEITVKLAERKVQHAGSADPKVNVQPGPSAESIEPPADPSPYAGSLHRSLTSTARTLRKAKADEYGCISARGPGLCGIVVHQDQAERALSVLQSLVSALEVEGLKLEPDETRMKITVNKDAIAFTLTEKSRRQKHIPTAQEQEVYDQRLARRQRAADRRNWDLYSSLPYEKPWPEFDTVYLGQLSLAVDGWSQGLRKTWADGKTQRIDTMIAAIVEGLKALLASDKAKREKREEDERLWAELSRRRDLAKKRKQREEARVTYLRELVELQREAADIRTWLATVPDEIESDQTTELARMIRWARGRLASLEERTTIKAAAVAFEGKALFPEVDELHDPLGEPPIPSYGW
jgi:hypothetical protein